MGASWETWDRLSRMNGGNPTFEMLEAQRLFEEGLKIDNLNEGNSIIASELGNEIVDEVTETPKNREQTVRDGITELDTAFDKQVALVYSNINTSFAEFKSGNAELSGLNESLGDTAAQMDELEIVKRRLLKDIKKRYPNMDAGSQIDLYNQQAESIDDQLFVLGRSYNKDLSEFNFKTTQAQAEYGFNIQKSENKLDFIKSIYDRMRWDMVGQETTAREDRQAWEAIDRQDAQLTAGLKREDTLYTRDTDRADLLIKNALKVKESDRKQAITDGDDERAKQLTYEKTMLEEQLKLNKKYGDDIKTLWGSAYLERNLSTWEWDLKSSDIESIWGAGAASSTGTTYKWFGISQDYWATTSPNSKDIADLANGGRWTPWTDFRTPIGTPVESFVEWTVVWVTLWKWNDTVNWGYWNQVQVKDSDGNIHMYSHLSWVDGWVSVQVWDTVDKWQSIGLSWNSWFSTGPHLDYRVSSNGKTSLKDWNWIDPKQFVSMTSSLPNIKWGRVQDMINQKWEELTIATLGQQAYGSGRAFSNEDSERAKTMLKANPEMWIIDFKDTVRGYMVFSWDKELWWILKNTLKQSWVIEFGVLSDFINEENNWQAIKSVERAVLATVDASKTIREDTVNTINQRADELLSLVNEAEGIVWPMDGTLEVFLGRIKDAWASKIQNRIQALVAKTRNELAWVAMSDNELELLWPLFPDITFRKEALVDAVSQMWVRATQELNNFRKSIGLPALDRSQVWAINYEDRVGLYKWNNTQGPTAEDKNINDLSEIEKMVNRNNTPNPSLINNINK